MRPLPSRHSGSPRVPHASPRAAGSGTAPQSLSGAVPENFKPLGMVASDVVRHAREAAQKAMNKKDETK